MDEFAESRRRLRERTADVMLAIENLDTAFNQGHVSDEDYYQRMEVLQEKLRRAEDGRG